jgi:delta1-piperideine-2-carboxylate reductase
MSDLRLSLEETHALASRVLLNGGLSEAQAKAIADTVTSAERDECKSHGLFRIPGYVKAAKSGKANGQAVPSVTELAPSVIQVDSNRGFSPLALQYAFDPLVDKARQQGIAAAGITNSHHFAALWPEVEELANRGLVAFAFTAALSYVAPAGGTKPLYGTNPMGFAWPRQDQPPLVFDQASSASARGEIQLHLRDGHSIPEGWAIGPDGQPTTDPQVALAGAQLCFGGYKGAAIALMVELLAGALIGDLFSFESTQADNGDGGPPTGGEFLLCIDPGRTGAPGGAGGAMAHAEHLFREILVQPGTRLPSDRRFEARTRTVTDGITVAPVLYEELQRLSDA